MIRGRPHLDRRVGATRADDATRFLEHPANRLDQLHLWAAAGTAPATTGPHPRKAAAVGSSGGRKASTLGRGVRVGVRPHRSPRRRIQDSASAQLPLFGAAPASAQLVLF